jgi:hypothetical protein
VAKNNLSKRRVFQRALRFEGLEQRLLLADDLDDALSEAASLGAITTTPKTASKRIDPDTDVDMYRFTVTAGQVVDFDIDTALNGPGGLGSYLRVFDAAGRQLAFNNDGAAPGENEVGFDAYLRHTFATSGTYYVGVSNLNNSSYDALTGERDTTGGLDAVGDYQLIVKGLPIDNDDSLSEATSLGAITNDPEIVDASIDPDIDVDLYRFTVTAGQVVAFDIDTLTNGPGGLGSFLRIFNAQGQELAFNDDARAPGDGQLGFDSYLTHTFAAAGTYYVGVSNANNDSYNPTTGNGDTAGGQHSIGDYQLIVRNIPPDADDTLTEATSLGNLTSVPKIVDASIDPDIDVDLYRFSVTDGQVVDFDVDTATNGPGGLGSFLRLFNAQGQQLAFNDDGAAPGENQVGFDAYLRHTFSAGGTYYVGVSNWNNSAYDPLTGNEDIPGGNDAVGDYRLNVRLLPIDDNDSVDEAIPLGTITGTPRTANATIDPDIDVDLYRFSVAADQIVDFDIDTAVNGPGGLGSFLRLFDSQGQQLAFNDDAAAPGETEVGFDAYLRHAFTAGGTYYIGVSNFNNASYNPVTGNGDTAGGQHSIGDYQLIVALADVPQPDQLIVTIDRTSIPEFNGAAVGTVTRSTASSGTQLVVALSSSQTDEATVPSSVVIPANQLSVSFTITAVDDGFVDGTQTVLITAEASGFVDGAQSLQVTDSDGVWHNRLRPFDVNNDNFVTPIDALLVINFLNTFGSGPVPTGSPPPFFDVNSDNSISPIDALMVINGLNGQSSLQATGEGEGEAATPEAQTTAAASSTAPAQALLFSAPKEFEPTGHTFHEATAFESTAAASRPHPDPFHSNESNLAALAAALVPAPPSTASLDEFFAELGAEREDSLLVEQHLL